jgi:hypothetical protein
MEEKRADDLTVREDPCWDDAYSEDGVDLTLIRAMLELTPAQRLELLQGNANAVWSIRRAAGDPRFSDDPSGPD